MQELIKIDGYDDILHQSIAVNSQEDLQRAAAFLMQIKQTKDKVEHSFNPIIEQAHKAHKEAITRRNEYLIPLENAEKITKQKISIYVTEQERIKEQEKQRQLAEMRRQEEERRKKIEEEALLKAQQFEALNKPKQVEHVLQQAQNKIEEEKQQAQIQQNVVQQFSPTKVETPTNIATRKVYKYRIIDVTKISRDFLVPDEGGIRKVVFALKKGAEKIVGGIEVYEECSISNRRV